MESRTNTEESPEEAKAHMKERVSRGVAKVAGALEGFTTKAKEEHLAEKASDALHKAGETTRNVTETGRQEMQQTRDAVKNNSKKKGGPQGQASEAETAGSKPVPGRV